MVHSSCTVECQDRLAAPPRQRVKAQRPVILPGKALHNGQTKSSPLAPKGAGQLLRLHAGTVVLHDDGYPVPGAPSVEGHRAALGHGFDAVVDQIDQNLSQFLFIRQDPQVLLHLNGEADPLVFRYLGVKQHKFLAKVYQALRIEVNQEMKSLEKFLTGAATALKPGGRLVVITYHSLEDRMVKNFIKAGNIEGKIEKDFYGNSKAPLKAVNRKPILPQESEISTNTRARSAKLRIAEKE